MFFLIFSLAFLLAAGLAFLFGALKAKRKRWQVSLSRIILTATSMLLATGMTLLVCWVILKAILKSLIEKGTFGKIGDLLTEVPSAQVAALAFVSMIVAPMIFLLFFAIFRPISSIFINPLARLMVKKADKQEVYYKDNGKVDKSGCLKLEKKSGVSIVVGGLSGVLLLCILMIPLVGFLDVASDAGSVAVGEVLDGQPIIADAIDATDMNIGSITVKAMGGGLIYDLITSYPTEDGLATFKHEGEFIGAAANAVIALTDKEADKQYQIDNLHRAGEAFGSSTLLPSALAELIDSAAESWKDGEDYYGVKLPEVGGDDMKPVVMSLVDGLANSTVDTIKVDFVTIIDVYCSFIENDVMKKIEGDPLAILSDEKCTSQILLALLNNPRMTVAVDGISDFGIDLIMSVSGSNQNKNGLYNEMMHELLNAENSNDDELKKSYSDIFDRYGLKTNDTEIDRIVKASSNDAKKDAISLIVSSDADFKNKTVLVTTDMITEGTPVITDTETEAKNLAAAYASMYLLSQQIDENDFDATDFIGNLGPALTHFSKTATMGDTKAQYILTSLMQSSAVRDTMGYSLITATNISAKIVDASKTMDDGYNTICADIQSILPDLSTITPEHITTSITQMSAASAEVMKEMVTPEFMETQGVSKESSESASSMLATTFENLADAKNSGMSEQEYQQESAAISNMVNVLMDATNAPAEKPTFSKNGEESVTGKSAQGFVDEIMNSKIMSKTVVAEVYGGGDTPKSNPLNTTKAVSDAEKQDFLAAANDSWSRNPQTAETEKTLTAIGATVNINIKLEGNTWVLA